MDRQTAVRDSDDSMTTVQALTSIAARPICRYMCGANDTHEAIKASLGWEDVGSRAGSRQPGLLGDIQE